jgi:hypothetical protein
MLGLIFGAMYKVWPWVTAPEFSACYVVFFVAFALDFSIVTLVFPTSLACYALIVSPKPPPTYWLCMLVYSEVCLIVGYAASIPCTKQCVDWGLCETEAAQMWGFPGTDGGKSFLRSSLSVFLAYLCTLLHRFKLLRRGEGSADAGRLGYKEVDRRSIASGDYSDHSNDDESSLYFREKRAGKSRRLARASDRRRRGSHRPNPLSRRRAGPVLRRGVHPPPRAERVLRQPELRIRRGVDGG